MKTFLNLLKNFPFNMLSGFRIGMSLLLLYPAFAGRAQNEVPVNFIYGNEWLFYNELAIFGKHKVLCVNDRMNESKRKMYLLDTTNQVTDTMVVSAIEDIIQLTDSTFAIWDFNGSVKILIRDNRFVMLRNMIITSDFSSGYGLEVFIDKYMIGRKYNKKSDACSFEAFEYPGNIYAFGRKPTRDETGKYKTGKNDTVWVLMTRIPPAYSGLKKSVKDSIRSVNGKIKPFTILPQKYTKRQRTNRYYGRDNLEKQGNSLYLFEKNSCSLYTFDMNNGLRLTNTVELPVNDPETEGWKYIYDFNGDRHYVVRRTRTPLAEETEDVQAGDESSRRDKTPQTRRYSVYWSTFLVNLNTQELSLIQEGPYEPVTISEGLIYAVVNTENSSDIYAFPTKGNHRLNKYIFVK